MWASEITKCFNEGRLGGSGMPAHQELSLPHVGPCGCMLTQTGGGGACLWIIKTTSCLPHFSPGSCPSVFLLRSPPKAWGAGICTKCLWMSKSPIFQEHLALVVSVASMCEVTMTKCETDSLCMKTRGSIQVICLVSTVLVDTHQ